MNSLRFYWCTGCGQWHDPAATDSSSIHYSMYWPLTEPNERNFDGTLEDLERFITARKLKAQDGEEFERRIDAMLL